MLTYFLNIIEIALREVFDIDLLAARFAFSALTYAYGPADATATHCLLLQ